MNMFTSYSGNNFTGWKNEKYDDLIERAAAEGSPKKRIALYNQAQKLLMEGEVAIVPLFMESINYLASPKVKGLDINSLGLLKIHRVRIE